MANAKFCESCGEPSSEQTTESTHTKRISEDASPLVLGYCLPAIGLAIVGLAVILALGFLMDYMPTPYPMAQESGPLGDSTSTFSQKANVLFTSGLLVVGGSVISSKGLQLIQAKPEPRSRSTLGRSP